MQKSTIPILLCSLPLSCFTKADSSDDNEYRDQSFSYSQNNGDDSGGPWMDTGSGKGSPDTGFHTDDGEEDRDSGQGRDDDGEDDGSGGEDDFPLAGIGDITGDCNVISLPEDNGLWVYNTLNFGAEVFDETLLSHGGSELFEAGTLGGSSILSEVMAFEVLHRCEIAFLIKTEGEIEYSDESGKKTDMLVEIDGFNVGVSVTRAFKWGEEAVFSEEDAYDLLSRKLEDVLLSGSNAADANPWDHAILHVMTYDPSYVPSLEAAYATLPVALTNETIVVITVTDGDDDFLY